MAAARPTRLRRRRRGDDLQRVRAGAGGREPGHRRAVPAGRPQRHRLQRGRHGHAAGRASGPAPRGSPRKATRTSPTRFLRASFKGWIYCRDNPDDCVQYVVDAGSTLGAGHQAWMMNEINALIWPSPDGIGALARRPGTRPSRPRSRPGSLPRLRPAEAFRTDLAEAAWEGIEATRPAPTSRRPSSRSRREANSSPPTTVGPSRSGGRGHLLGICAQPRAIGGGPVSSADGSPPAVTR